MQFNFKKILACALSAAMVLTAAPLTSTTANAAAKVKLSATKGTIKVGKTKKVTIKNTTKSNIKKVTFKYSKSGIVKAKRSGLTIKLTGKKKGTSTVTVKVTLKKAVAGKKSYTLKYKATVKKATTTPVVEEVKTEAISLDVATATVVEGQTVTLVATKTPVNSTQDIEWSSDKPEIATVVNGVVTGVKAGEAVITAKSGDASATCTVTVTAAEVIAKLTDAKQTKANEVQLTFDVDATKLVNKDDIKVERADGTMTTPVNKITFSADGKTADIVLASALADKTDYKVSYKDSTSSFTASVGEVASIVIHTAQAEQNVKTPIEFSLMDANGVDVTAAQKVDETVRVELEGSYSSAELATPSKAAVTMATKGDKATVTITYNSNAKDAQDVKATGEIVCVDAKAVVGTKLFAQTTSTNAKSECAKFYNGLSDTTVTAAEGKDGKPVYFCVKDANGDVISYDEYSVESSNDDVMSASTDKTTGRYAKITVHGNTVGSATLNVKAIKNGVPSYYTIPATVTKSAEATNVTISLDRNKMSNAYDEEYFGTVTVKAVDAAGNEVPSTEYTSLEVKIGGDKDYSESKYIDSYAPVKQGFDLTGTKYTAYGAKAGSYPIKAVLTKKDGKTVERTLNVSVTALPKDAYGVDDKDVKPTYSIELTKSTLDVADPNNNSAKARVYATVGGMFAGYVRNHEITDPSGSYFLGEVGSPITLAPVTPVAGTWTVKITAAGAENETLTAVGQTYTINNEDAAKDAAGQAAAAAAAFNAADDWSVSSSEDVITFTEANGREGKLSAPTLEKGVVTNTTPTSTLTWGSVTPGVKGVEGVDGGTEYWLAINSSAVIKDVVLGVKFGSIYAAGGRLYGLDVATAEPEVSASSTDALDITTIGGADANGYRHYVSGDATKDKYFARPGSYTVFFNYVDNNGKEKTGTNSVTVKNTMTVPKITVTSRTVDTISSEDIAKVLKTNVDMNNDESDYASVQSAMLSGTVAASGDFMFDEADEKDNKVTVKYVAVEEGKTVFYIPINSTFKAE